MGRHSSKTPSPRNAPSTRPEPSAPRLCAAERFLLRGVDAGLAAAVLLVPLAMGGRSALGHLVLAALAIWLAACWSLRCCLTSRPDWSWSWAEPVVLGAVGLVVFQLFSLPPSAIASLSPHLYSYLPLWSPSTAPEARLGVWSTLSLSPALTQIGLVVLASHGILLLVTLQRVRQIEDVERVVRLVAVAAAAMAGFGLIQYVLGNGKFFWFYEHPFAPASYVPTGSFTNRNHFAHFVVLGIGPLVWWLQSSLGTNRDMASEPASGGPGNAKPLRLGGRPRDASAALLIAALALCVFAVLLSLSRGGVAAMFSAAAICLLVLYRGRLLDGRTLLFLLGTGALLAVSLIIYGYKAVSSRLEDFQSVNRLDRDAMRRSIWQANLAAIRDFPYAGAGVGSHSLVYPMYLRDNEANQYCEFVHAESGYLQIGLETGIAGWALLAAGMGLCALWCLAPLRRQPSQRVLLGLAAVVPSLAASALHSVVDFVWYTAGCVVPVMLLAACAFRLYSISRGSADHCRALPMPRLSWAAALAGLGLAGFPMVSTALAELRAEPSWHRFLVQARKLGRQQQPARLENFTAMAKDLNEVIRWQPYHSAAHARLAEVCLRMFDYSQGETGVISARQVRDTVPRFRFRSREELFGWLARAFPAHYEHLLAALHHARRALALCPLHAEAYLALAAVGYLEEGPKPDTDSYVEQALRVRPFDGTVLFEAGQEALLAAMSSSDPARSETLAKEALRRWQGSFQCGSYHQERIIHLLADQAPAEFFLQTFAMDLAAIKRLEAHLSKSQRPDRLAQLQVLLRPRAETARQQAARAEPAEALQAWLDAADAHKQLQETGQYLDCLRNAVRCDFGNYQVRRELATALYEAGQRSEAYEHLKWCLRQKPHDERVRSLVQGLVMGQSGPESPAPAGPARFRR